MNLLKKTYIVNGMARSGKDTFANILRKKIPTLKYSSIDEIKEIAKKCGWDGLTKTERDRKFLSDLKILTTEYSDFAFNAIKRKHNTFLCDAYYEVMLIDIREPFEIERTKNEFSAKTIFIENINAKNITSNIADKNVFNYEYDYIVENNSTLEDFEKNIIEFMRKENLI